MKLKGTLNKVSNHLKANTYNKKKASKQKRFMISFWTFCEV